MKTKYYLKLDLNAPPEQLKSFLYKVYTNIGIFLGLRLIPLGISFKDIEFFYKHDTVFYIFPWSRRNGIKWISLGCDGEFKSLKDIDNFWKEYNDFEPSKLEEPIFEREFTCQFGQDIENPLNLKT